MMEQIQHYAEWAAFIVIVGIIAWFGAMLLHLMHNLAEFLIVFFRSKAEHCDEKIARANSCLEETGKVVDSALKLSEGMKGIAKVERLNSQHIPTYRTIDEIPEKETLDGRVVYIKGPGATSSVAVRYSKEEDRWKTVFERVGSETVFLAAANIKQLGVLYTVPGQLVYDMTTEKMYRINEIGCFVEQEKDTNGVYADSQPQLPGLQK